MELARTSSATGHALPALDALRGVAITLVFLRHASGTIFTLPVGEGAARWVGAVMLGGHSGVSLFFILSAFLLARPFLAEAAGGPRLSRFSYAIRRTYRIMPLYFVVVTATVLAKAHAPADLLQAVPYLLFLQLIPGMTIALVPDSLVWWSLATEVQFYLALPLLPLALRSRMGRRVGLTLLLLYTAWYVAFAVGAFRLSNMQAQHFLAHSLAGRGPLFAFGILAAVLYDARGRALRVWAQRARPLRAGGADLLLLATLGALAALLRVVGPMSYIELETTLPAWHLVEGLLWTAVLLLVLLAPLAVRPLLVSRVPVALGVISYSVFLLHVPILAHGAPVLRARVPGLFAATPLGKGMLGLCACAAVVAVSTLTYWAIERPMIKRGARVARWRSPSAR